MTDPKRSSLELGALIALGIVFGIAGLVLLRFVNLPTEQRVHYHANWAVFIDGQRMDLTDNRYMEDVFQCTADPSSQRPEDRVHMHGNNQDIVHVHASGAAWGHLLGNLGFGIGDDYLEVGEERYTTNGERSLKFILNGTPVRSIRNRAVGDEDRLLISYGTESADELLGTQFGQVASNAGEYNLMPDPASCSGPQEEAFGDRIRRAFWF